MSLTIDPALVAKIKRIAKRERRSVSSLVEHLIDLEWDKMKAEHKGAAPRDPRTDTGIYNLSRTTAVP